MPLALLDSLGTSEIVFIGILAILLFGKDLPTMMRKAGRKITEFKRNVATLQGELRSAAGSLQDEVGDSVRELTNTMRGVDSDVRKTVRDAGDSMQEAVDGTGATDMKKKRKKVVPVEDDADTGSGAAGVSGENASTDGEVTVSQRFAPPEETVGETGDGGVAEDA